MKRLLLGCLFLFSAVVLLKAQNWTSQDSIHLQRFLNQETEMQLNTDALRELSELFQGVMKTSTEKRWMEYEVPSDEPEHKIRLTLQPYSPTTPYNWDPVYRKKIDIDKPAGMTLYGNQWRASAKPTGLDFMKVFTKDFWNRRHVKRRNLTLKLLKEYGDSITVREIKTRSFVKPPSGRD